MFVKELFQRALQLLPRLNINIERANRALNAKSKNPTAASRSLIVKFMDFTIKESVLRQAWAQRKILF